MYLSSKRVPERRILHKEFQKFSRDYTPEPPCRKGATASLHPLPARLTASREGAPRSVTNDKWTPCEEKANYAPVCWGLDSIPN
jgi:hypothetical protein